MAKNNQHKNKHKEQETQTPILNPITSPPKQEKQSLFARFRLAILIILSALIYSNAIYNGFVLDDIAVIGLNRLVQQGFEGIPKLLTTGLLYGYNGSNMGTYRPIAMVSFAIENGLFGNTPMHFHIVNIILYALLIWVVYIFVERFFATTAIGIRFLIVLLFVVHPIHTEVVANIKSRDEILCMLFSFLSILNIDKYLKNKNIGFLILSIFNFLIAILSKETAITFLVITPILIAYKYGYSLKKVILPAGLSVLITFGLYALIKMVLFGSVTNIQTGSIDIVDNYLIYLPTLSAKIASALFIYFNYLKLLVIPHPLSYDYSFNQVGMRGFAEMEVLVFIGLSLLAAYHVIKNIKNIDLLSVGIFIFFGTSIITANLLLFIGSAMAERFMFIPSFGFIIILLALFDKLTAKQNKTELVGFYSIPFLIIAVVFSSLTYKRNFDWKNNITLYRSDVKHAPNSARTNYSIGNELWRMSERSKIKDEKTAYLAEAVGHLEKALKIHPDYGDALFTLGNVYHDMGEYDKEVALMKKQEDKGLTNNMMFYNSGNALLEKGDYVNAIKQYRKAIELTPGNSEPYINMGSAYLQLGNPDSAIEIIKLGIEKNKNYPQAYINLASAFIAKKEFSEGEKNLKIALKLDSNSVEANVVLGNLYNNSNRIKLAIVHLYKACKLNPDFTQGWYNLGVAYISDKDYNSAIAAFNRAIQLNPNHLEARMNIGYSLMMQGKYQESITYYEAVTQMAPNYKAAYQSLAFLYKKIGNNAKAQEALAKGK